MLHQVERRAPTPDNRPTMSNIQVFDRHKVLIGGSVRRLPISPPYRGDARWSNRTAMVLRMDQDRTGAGKKKTGMGRQEARFSPIPLLPRQWSSNWSVWEQRSSSTRRLPSRVALLDQYAVVVEQVRWRQAVPAKRRPQRVPVFRPRPQSTIKIYSGWIHSPRTGFDPRLQTGGSGLRER